MRKDGVNLQRNTRGQFAAKCGGQIARNIQLMVHVPVTTVQFEGGEVTGVASKPQFCALTLNAD